MSIPECVSDLRKQKKISKGFGDRMLDLYTREFNRLKPSMSHEAAESAASEAALRGMEADAELKLRQNGLQILSQKRMIADIAGFKGDGFTAIAAMIGDDSRAKYGSVEVARERIEFQSHQQIKDFIERHRRDLRGHAQDKATLDAVVDELHGTSSGNEQARTAAEAISDVFETLRQRFNSAGGAIGKLEHYGGPHKWSALKVRATDYATWRGDVLAELARDRMHDRDTGRLITDEALDEAMQQAYRNIRANGLTGEPTAMAGRGKLANRRNDARFFIFKDGPAWRRIQAKYGEGDAFGAIMTHIGGMSRDIAMMERFGPNPDASIRWGKSLVSNAQAGGDEAHPGVISGTSANLHRLDRLWDYVTGNSAVPVLEEGAAPLARLQRGTVRTLAGLRDLMGAAMLGSSPISALPDLQTQRMARKINGLPDVGMLRGLLSQLSIFSGDKRALAIDLGLGMRDASRELLGMSRYFGETTGPHWSSVIADDVMRLSGINKWTEANQRWFGVDLLRTLGLARGQNFDALEPRLRGMLARNGIEAATWDAMRTAPTTESDGAHYLDWRNMPDQAHADTLHDMVLRETRAAVQETTWSSRAATAPERPGTFRGEAWRGFMQFKGFSFAILTTQGRRIAQIAAEEGNGSAARYSASLALGMMIFGAASIQLREFIKGRDFRPMDNWEFWVDSMLQSGGLGIAGDLIGSFNNDRIDSIGQFFSGPLGSLAAELKNGVLADAKHAAEGKDTHLGRHLVRLGERYLPGQNLWYSRLIGQRLLWDEIQSRIDPNHAQSFQMMENIAHKQRQGYWWRPGETAPERAPTIQ